MSNTIPLTAALVVLGASGLGAQVATRGLEIGAVPAINFDSDEGFGYGAIAELYQYGTEGRAPYEWTLQPTVFITTEGRRDVTVFFDAPNLLPAGWRFDVFLGWERHVATPYYGLGNASDYDEGLDDEEGPNPFYYRFGRTRWSATTTVQRRLGASPYRLLAGIGLVHTSVLPVPESEGTTLLAQQQGADEWSSEASYVRLGAVRDTRDRETGPTRGSWSEVLVQRIPELLGADRGYTRWTVTHRHYVPVTSRLVLAGRILVQSVGTGAPVQDLFLVQTSFKQQEGLGGSKTVRGVLKNRFTGRGMAVMNAEARWRALDFTAVGRDFHLVLSAFADHGRVWAGDVRADELFKDLHRGVGGGLRVGMGENFTVAVDVATSEETGLPVYVGLGYLF